MPRRWPVPATAAKQLSRMTPTLEPFHFTVRVAPGPVTLITVCGELDIATAPAFEDALGEIDFACLTVVVLDLERLDFIDAAGLRAVLALHAACVHASVALAVTPGPPSVQRVFELTGTDQLLPFSRR